MEVAVGTPILGACGRGARPPAVSLFSIRRKSLERLAVCLAAALAACTQPARESAPARLPPGTPIVLISVDTLRADRLPAYGYEKVETPAIDALRRDAILFRRAYTHAPLTLPAHASLFTGVLPPAHGVRDNMGYPFEADGLSYLPRTLKEMGYATGAAVSAWVLRSQTGLGDGFDFYDDRIAFRSWTELGAVQRSGAATLEAVREWLPSVAERPFFLFFHIFEPHAPYTPPEPFGSRYESPYDGEVAAADDVVGGLLAELGALGMYDRALIVLLSDHGEGLGDHGDLEHGPLLYTEVLRVPLLLKLPGGARGGTVFEQTVRLVDIYPTILDLLGRPLPPGLDGQPLLANDPMSATHGVVYSETYFPRLHFGWSDLASLIDHPYHFILGPDPELYDLEQDPGETRNLHDEQRSRAGELRRALSDRLREFQPPGRIDEETRQRLRALGYLGDAARDSQQGLADPKSRLGVIRILARAFEELGRRDFVAAEATFRSVLQSEPQLTEAWEFLGHCLMRQGRIDEALRTYLEALELSRGAPRLSYAVAGALLELDRLDEARHHAEIASRAYEGAFDLLAQIALRTGDLETAERHLQQAEATGGTRIDPQITRAQLLLARGRLRQVLDLARTLEEEVARGGGKRDLLRGLFFIRGVALARLGETVEAERAFLTEIELDPHALLPHSHLAFLYAVEGRTSDAGRMLEQMLEANPRPAAYLQAIRTLKALGDPNLTDQVRREARQRWPEDVRFR